MKKMKLQYLLPITVALMLTTAITIVHSMENTESSSQVLEQAGKGQLVLPTEYRKNWAHLGTWLAHDEGDAQGFHDVYTQPESVDYYKQNGKFKDGTILIKEVRNFHKGALTTGKVSWANDIKVVFMMIKDSEGKYKGSPNWGEGWAWALFAASDLTKNISADYKTDCLGCHIPAKAKDYVFTEGYPTLK